MGKVIDLVSRLKTTDFEKPEMALEPKQMAPVVQLDEQKQKMVFNERRQVKRTILSDLISAMLVIPEKGLLKITVHDISEDGISFDLDDAQGQFNVGEELSLRVYINQKSYFPIAVTVKHITAYPYEGVIRHGSEYIKTEGNNVALQHFVKFVESASQGLKNDSGDLMTNKTS